jgi:hypothetical protein
MIGLVIAISSSLVFFGAIALCFVSYFRLQRHRADGEAMANYRTLAEQVAASQDALHAQLAELTSRLAAVEKLLHSVD